MSFNCVQQQQKKSNTNIKINIYTNINISILPIKIIDRSDWVPPSCPSSAPAH